ncbi:hypothetical protein ACL02S_17280 [Nocardia sp. 004]|uniref:hypothetical protein n=1 Tax=Nocardia sp. 004 TaxID=3385978 RepID=UPI00399FAAE3
MNPYLILTLCTILLIVGAAEVFAGYIRDTFSEKANKVLRSWGTVTIIFSIPPIVAMTRIISTGDDSGLPVPFRIFLSVYVIVLAIIAGYPLEKVKRL